jgi:multiple sugar transport system permease protein/putative aldouronate transport system permease protein
MRRVANYPLQTYLQTVVMGKNFAEIIGMVDTREIAEKLSTRSMQAAMIFVAMLPILVLYPFLQRYFLTGLTLGSVKG